MAEKGHYRAGNITMETARGNGTIIRRGFKGWERELLESPEVRRKATVAQLCKSSWFNECYNGLVEPW